MVGHVGGEEGGDGVEDVGQSSGLGGVPSPAVLTGFAGPILAQLALPAIPRKVRGPADRVKINCIVLYKLKNLVCGSVCFEKYCLHFQLDPYFSNGSVPTGAQHFVF